MRRGGFTLLEFLIVLSLVALLLTAGFTTYRKLRWRAEVREALTQLATALREARSQAQRYNVSVRVRFLSDRAYALEPTHPTTLPIRRLEQHLSRSLDLEATQDASTWRSVAGLEVTYHAPFGETSAVPLMFRVRHRRAPSLSACLRVFGVTGKVVVARACP